MKKYNKKLYSDNPEFSDRVTELVATTIGIPFKMQTWRATNTLLVNLIQYGKIEKYEKDGSNLHKIIMRLRHHGYLVVQKYHGRYTKYVMSTTEKFRRVFGT